MVPEVVLKFVSRPKGLGELVCKSKIECKLRVYMLRVYRLEVCARALLRANEALQLKVTMVQFKFYEMATNFEEIV